MIQYDDDTTTNIDARLVHAMKADGENVDDNAFMIEPNVISSIPFTMIGSESYEVSAQSTIDPTKGSMTTRDRAFGPIIYRRSIDIGIKCMIV